MSLFKQFGTSSEKEQNGIDIEYGANEDGTVPKFRIRRMSDGNIRYQKTLDREMAPYKRLIQLGTLDDKISRRLVMRAFCSEVLVSWEHVQDKDGKDIPFSFDAAMSIFEQLHDLYLDLLNAANKASMFQDEALETGAKNS